MNSKPSIIETDELAQEWSELLIGQPDVIEAVIPYLRACEANLNPAERPAGIFLLIGPTGTGKTHCAESLAEILHRSPKHYLKVDCSEFQLEHDIAKLTGANPGYQGHRETQPYFTQSKINGVASDNCTLSIVLFDEIEKASVSMERILLGILDKGILRLGDNTSVSFERTIILMSSNVGSKQMQESVDNRFGFAYDTGVKRDQINTIAGNAVKRRFTPEFLNRIDTIVPYHTLSRDDYRKILARMISLHNRHIIARLALKCFTVSLEPAGEEWLLDNGISDQYGARELKRTLHKHFFHPVATMAAKKQIAPQSEVVFDADSNGPILFIREREKKEEAA